MFGVSYATLRFEGGAYVMPATTPTQFEPALYAAAVRDLAAAAPSVMYLTHFSALDFAPDQADSLCRQLDAYATLGERCADEPGRLESEILAISRQELERMLPPKQAMEAASRLTMDAKLNAQGIAWWQQARTGAGG